MDVLRPNLVNIEGRLFRNYGPIQKLDTTRRQDHNSCEIEEVDNDRDDETNGIQFEDGKFTLFVNDIPSTYFKFIIGKKGETKQRLEKETSTRINVPKRDIEGPIEIVGKSRSGVLSAKTRVEVIIENSKQHQSGTHFISIPIQSNEITENFDKFHRNVMKTCSMSNGVSDEIFQIPQRLHLTLSMMTLLSQKEMDTVCVKFKEIVTKTISNLSINSPLKIKLKGIEYMNDDPSEVDVLYAKIEQSISYTKLQEFCESIVKQCDFAGISKSEKRALKLHVTIMNSTFRKQSDRKNNPNQKSKKKPTFDARRITQIHKDYEFGTIDLNKIAIATRGQFSEDGDYVNLIELPISS